jgi:acetylornithine/succinyldiaminopimelate/putrescine aminotransferase
MGARLQEISEATGRVRAIRGTGMMWGLDIGEPAGEVVARAREAGLLILTAGDHTLRLLPPLVTSKDDLARGLSIIEQVI